MDKYLISILKEINTIIVPGIGALTITNQETGEIMFMPFLKHDEGTLARFIAEKEGWDENAARNLISKYVREIESKLNVGESYDMYQFGSFRKEGSGDIVFEQWKNGVEEVQSSENKESCSKESEEFEELPGEIVETEYVPEPELLTGNVLVEEEEKNEAPVPLPVKEEEVVPEQKEEVPVYTEEQQWNDDLDLPPINATVERPKKPILEKAKSDKKRRKLPVLPILIFLVIAVGGGSLLIVFWEDLSGKNNVTVAKEETETLIDDNLETEGSSEENVEKATAELEEMKEEESAVEIAPVENEPQSADQITTSTGTVFGSMPFHLIAGAFSELANAERFRDKQRERGRSNAEIIGKFDGLYLVSSGSFTSQMDAENAKAAEGGRSWIFQWP